MFALNCISPSLAAYRGICKALDKEPFSLQNCNGSSHMSSLKPHEHFAGVYAQGGPSVVEKRITMESLTDRTNSLSRNKRMTA